MLKRYSCFLLALSLVLSPLYSAPVYHGPVLPQGWYPIHETELDELETALLTAQTDLRISADKLQLLRIMSDQQVAQLTELSKSFNLFAAGERVKRRWLTLALIGTSALCIVLALK
jgi:hypothetical protein